jgi:hypothetical protein
MERKQGERQVRIPRSIFIRVLISCSVEKSAPVNDSINPPQSTASKLVPKDGFEALKGLQHVRNVICVAFGAFDRYYISWEDNDGLFHQS